MSLSIVILAAGAGTRMKSETPKVLHKLCGKEMLYYVIEESLKLTDNVSIVLYHKEKLIREFIESSFKNIDIHIQNHKDFPGTGGALKGLNFEDEKILVLNGDMPLIEAKEFEKFLDIDSDIVMSSIELENPDGYGRVIIEDREVKRIVEQKDATESELKIKSVNAGVYLFKKSFLEKYTPLLNNSNAQSEFYITDLIEFAVKDNLKVSPIFVKESNFKGVNSKLDLANAESIMQNRIKKRLMQSGVIMRMPETIYIEYGVKIDGESIIENGVSILNNSKIINSHIKSNSIIEDSEIIESEIGPLARVRPKSYIKNSKVGNFVEIKKSKLNGVKAGHLSYLGDAEIDEDTNIGAGTITCNYDGKSKYKTKIGKNVFIGSDTQIIAPISISDNVIIGAGTTITKDIPKGALAISREPLKIIKNFFYKFFN